MVGTTVYISLSFNFTQIHFYEYLSATYLTNEIMRNILKFQKQKLILKWQRYMLRTVSLVECSVPSRLRIQWNAQCQLSSRAYGSIVSSNDGKWMKFISRRNNSRTRRSMRNSHWHRERSVSKQRLDYRQTLIYRRLYATKHSWEHLGGEGPCAG